MSQLHSASIQKLAPAIKHRVSDAIGGGRWANRVTLWQDLCQDPVIVLGLDGQKVHAVLLAKVLGFIEA